MPREILLTLSLITAFCAVFQPVTAAPERVAILGDSITPTFPRFVNFR